MKALDGVHAAAVQIGSLLILKCTSDAGQAQIFTRTLTQDEIKALEIKPTLLTAPTEPPAFVGDW